MPRNQKGHLRIVATAMNPSNPGSSKWNDIFNFALPSMPMITPPLPAPSLKDTPPFGGRPPLETSEPYPLTNNGIPSRLRSKPNSNQSIPKNQLELACTKSSRKPPSSSTTPSIAKSCCKLTPCMKKTVSITTSEVSNHRSHHRLLCTTPPLWRKP